ncbi:unnamed protein product [Arctia plantaginis]|uniref:Uncharacterized protein n=1 Tax=Arctia plantaginis TaxID=874455 RepID=A0A8S0ZK98_ARCPL|nr:unnamed protein product [Arctia plantaginis]
MEKLVSQVKKWRGVPDRVEDLSHSQYSLVSNGDLTVGTLQLWLELPDEIKYDPALDQFKTHYEKEHGSVLFLKYELDQKKTILYQMKHE